MEVHIAEALSTKADILPSEMTNIVPLVGNQTAYV
jgi:hypothetical protein